MSESVETYDIAELKKIVSFAARIGCGAGKVLQDGKVTLADFQYGPDFFMAFPILVQINWQMIMPEIKDFSAEETAELVNWFCSEFDIPQDTIEITIEKVLQIITNVVVMVMNLINVFKNKSFL